MTSFRLLVLVETFSIIITVNCLEDNHSASLSYDYIWLSLNDRGGVCSLSGMRSPDPGEALPWTVQSQWPMRGNCRQSYCPNGTLESDSTKSCQKIAKRFIDYNTTSDILWKHAYTESGRCAICPWTNRTGSVEYFNVALQLYKNYDISEWLADKQIIPSDKQAISRGRIERIVSQHFAGSYYLYCRGKKNEMDILQEVRLCFDRQLQPRSGCYPPKITCYTKAVWYLENLTKHKRSPSALFVALVTVIALFMSRN